MITRKLLKQTGKLTVISYTVHSSSILIHLLIFVMDMENLALLQVMMGNGQTCFKNLVISHRNILKYVWPFFIIIHERANTFYTNISLF